MSKITAWIMTKANGKTAEIYLPQSRARAIQGLVRSLELPWAALQKQGWVPMEFILNPVNNTQRKKKNPPLLQAGVLTQSEEERMNRAKEKLELLSQSKKALTVTTLAIIAIISIFNVRSALASPSPEGFFCVERPWNCEYIRDVMRESVRTPVIRKFNHPGGRHDLVPELAAKVGEILSACGAKLISGFRPGAHVAGTHHPSLHSAYPSRAADLAHNPSCIYAHLVDWAGGYSVDYNRVRHVHISYSPPGSGYLAGREWHMHFVHGGGHHHRYAQHRKQLRG